MVRNTTVALLLMLSNWAVGQQQDSTRLSQEVEVDLGTLISSPESLPFWMKHSNGGRFSDKQAKSVYSLIHYSGSYDITEWLNPKWEFEAISSASERGIYGSLVQANFSLESPIAKITAGLDEEVFGLNDSILSVGSLSYGNNSLPLPKVSIQTNGWVDAPILSQTLSFKAYLAHGWFESNRVQSRAFLHQKYFYGRAQFFQKRLSLIGGLLHNVQWGGRNLSAESVQPTGFRNYARIFLGMSGGGDALQTDQKNALGNHLGSYDLRGSYRFKLFTISNYWQFLWEDSSGMNPLNWRDGMVGMSISLNQTSWLDRFVIEVVRTNDQDAYKVGNDGVPFVEPDHFFNNGVYGSGWTHNNRVIGTPMFLVVDSENGARNIIQNKVNALNLGVGGHLKSFEYTLRYIYFKNNGTITEPYDPSMYVESVDLSVAYQLSNISNLSMRMTFQDSNFNSGASFGLNLGYSWRFGF